jgi:hypothetical protein
MGEHDVERRAEHHRAIFDRAETVPSVAVSTRLPAFLATKSRPTPWPPKISSGGDRLSAQAMIVAKGA